MNVVVLTGATGTIGSAIARRLVERGDVVRAVVRSVERGRRLLPDGVEPVLGDVTDAAALRRAISGADTVIHAAGLPEQWRRDPSDFQRVNVDGTAMVCEAALAVSVHTFLYTSTIDVFAAVPSAEFDEATIDETPRQTAYERSKQAADRIVVEATRRGLPARTLHPAAVYGPAPVVTPGLNDVIRRLARGRIPALPPGRIPVVLSDDVADGHLLAMRAPIGSRYILSESSVSMAELGRAIVSARGHGRVPPTLPYPLALLTAVAGEGLSRLTRRAPLLARGQLHFVSTDSRPSSRRARDELGWTPTPVHDGIARTLADMTRRGQL